MFKKYHIGHFINQPKNSTQFEILDFETMQEPEVEDLHKHTFYEILWIEKGKTKQFIDYQEYEISDNTLFFISPNQLHLFEAWHDLKGLTIMFTEDFFLLNQQNQDLLFELSFLDNLYTNPFLNLSKEDTQELKLVFELLTQEKERKDSSQSILQSLLNVLLAKIQRCVNQTNPTPFDKIYLRTFKRFKILLDQYFDFNQPASFYAEKLAMTTHHLNLVAKQITGKKVSEVIRARSILEAKRLLTFTNLTSTEIAFKLGYEEPSYFSRVFKQETAMTPYQFKQSISESIKFEKFCVRKFY
jgi:AraC-like DNA-binding protein/mannose-6-phosphate isomerase-like protein (cupin superfamily)